MTGSLTANVPDFELPGIVPWGRRLDEYAAFFALGNLTPERWGRVLDVGAGPASFAAEAAAQSLQVLAIDPLYDLDAAEIRRRYDAASPAMVHGIQRAGHRFVWQHYGSIENLLRKRREALDLFLQDYLSRPSRYLAAALPNLPFADASFGLALSSHLLFLYAEELDAAFHIAALRELCRVAREVRVFPLVALDGSPSPHVEKVSEALHSSGLAVERVPVPFEFQRGATDMLRLSRAS